MPSIHLTQNYFYKSAPLLPNSSLACFGTFSMKYSLPYNLNQSSLCPLLSLKNQLCQSPDERMLLLSLRLLSGCKDYVFTLSLPYSCLNIAPESLEKKHLCALEIHAFLIPSSPPPTYSPHFLKSWAVDLH